MAIQSWVPTSNFLGIQNINTNSTVQNHPLGMVIQAKHETYGQGEFIYLQGIGSTAVGSTVEYNKANAATALAAVGGNQPVPIAIAMSACVASQYGWYQISGVALATKTCTVCLVAGVAVGVLTTGLIAGTGSGKEVQGAVCHTTRSAKAGVVAVELTLNRPHLQGRVT